MSDYSVFEMKGPDARDFLHRLTTADVRNLGIGEITTGFFLEATGKIRAYFHLIGLEKDRFLLVTPRGRDDIWKKSLLQVLDQFTFAEKYELNERTDLTAVESTVAQGLHSVPLTTGLFLNVSQGEVSPTSPADLEKQRILALYPRVDAELTPAVNPLEIGLRSAIADQKGCYPGQEVIEKIISLGSPARRLGLLCGKGAAPAPGEKVLNEGGAEAGEVTSAIQDGDEVYALALLRKVHARPETKLLTATGTRLTLVNVSPYEETP